MTSVLVLSLNLFSALLHRSELRGNDRRLVVVSDSQFLLLGLTFGIVLATQPLIVLVLLMNFEFAGHITKISQMPIILVPLHFDRDPLSHQPSCQRSVVIRPFITSDFMTGIAAVPGKHIAEEVCVHIVYRELHSFPGNATYKDCSHCVI